jgi:hypothetical protein
MESVTGPECSPRHNVFTYPWGDVVYSVAKAARVCAENLSRKVHPPHPLVTSRECTPAMLPQRVPMLTAVSNDDTVTWCVQMTLPSWRWAVMV